MQFWIIDKDADKNAKLLPDMALRTNIREGYQILSDIGYIHGVIWPYQNKCYSKSHVTTRKHCVNKKAFGNFVLHYQACLFEAEKRGFKVDTYRNKYKKAIGVGLYIPEYRTEEQFQLEYLLTKKYNKAGKQQITDEEIKKLVDTKY